MFPFFVIWSNPDSCDFEDEKTLGPEDLIDDWKKKPTRFFLDSPVFFHFRRETVLLQKVSFYAVFLLCGDSFFPGINF